MLYSLYAGNQFLMSSNDRDKLTDATVTQVRRWIEEMGIKVGDEVELRLYHKGIHQVSRKFVPAFGRMHGWK
jgi:hypothetical protein